MSAAEYYGTSIPPHQQTHGAEGQHPQLVQHNAGNVSQPGSGMQDRPQPQSPTPAYQPIHTQQPPMQPPIQSQPYTSPATMQYAQEKPHAGGSGRLGKCGIGLCACCAAVAGFGCIEGCENCVNELDCATCVEGCC